MNTCRMHSYFRNGLESRNFCRACDSDTIRWQQDALVFLSDISQWSMMNEIYIQYFPVNKPARSALGANGLALGALTEIECIATVSA